MNTATKRVIDTGKRECNFVLTECVLTTYFGPQEGPQKQGREKQRRGRSFLDVNFPSTSLSLIHGHVEICYVTIQGSDHLILEVVLVGDPYICVFFLPLVEVELCWGVFARNTNYSKGFQFISQKSQGITEDVTSTFLICLYL